MRYRILCDDGYSVRATYKGEAIAEATALYQDALCRICVSVFDSQSGDCIFSIDADDDDDDGPIMDRCSGSWGSNIEDQIDSGFWL